GQLRSSWSPYTSGPVPWSGVVGMAVDGQGNVYVGGTSRYIGENQGLLKLSSAGERLATWGGNADFVALAIGPAGEMYGVTGSKDSIVVFSPDGQQVGEFEADSRGMTVDPDGNVYTAFQNRIQKYSAAGDLLAS